MASRLSIAVSSLDVPLPDDGRFAVFGPPAEFDLSALPKDRLHILQGHFPDHHHFAAQGFATTTVLEGDYAAALVVLPRAKQAARAWIAEATTRLPEGAPILVDGQKTDGVDSLIKALRGLAPVEGVLAKHHGKTFWIKARPLPDWAAQDFALADGFVTRPGVFSADKIDRGSAHLAAHLPATLPKRVADFGAGWGYLSRAILDRDGVETLALYEADHTALECAKRNVQDPRASFHWADVTTLTDGPFDAVITNPPFHIGRTGDPALGRAFLAAAARCLTPAGQVWLVANRHLPYEHALQELFSEVRTEGDDPGFKIIVASRPRRGKAAPRR